ncbi:hypothetical protein B0J11DRAFT_523286 [Dendryphion nanum]|uniref:Uncharacterized protein n=1 Tax=Dendryphion nanum TaxID=256645 RepID=A0A9P9E4D6_9PLEO|nr:hypothetical protein B0J11DRAFT_523286 [Dendryphion nanum]
MSMQVVLSPPEFELIAKLREHKSKLDCNHHERVRLLHQTVHLNTYCDDRKVGGILAIDLDNAIEEFALAALSIQQTILSDEWQLDPTDEEDDDVDSVIGQEMPLEDTGILDDEISEPPSWTLVKEEVLPDYIDRVCFSIQQTERTEARHDELEKRFPDVDICYIDGHVAPQPTLLKANGVGLPKGAAHVLLLGGHDEWDACSKGRAMSPNSVKVQDKVEKPRPAREQISSEMIGTFDPDSMELDAYYEKLVDLCVVANEMEDEELQEKILCQWQETNYSHTGFLPDLSIAIKAFQMLPTGSSLRNWITITYSYLWSTADCESFEEFTGELGDIKMEAVANFLFGIAKIRCCLTEGLDLRILESWCEFSLKNDHFVFHKHGSSAERKRCLAWRDKISGNMLKQEQRLWENMQLEEAEETIKKLGGGKRKNNPVGRARGPLGKKRLMNSCSSPHATRGRKRTKF